MSKVLDILFLYFIIKNVKDILHLEDIMNKSKNNFIKYFIFIIVYAVSLIIPYLIKNTTISIWINVIRYLALGTISFFLFKDLYKDSINHWKSKPLKCIILVVVIFIIDIIATIISQIPLAIINPEYTSINDSNISIAIETVSWIIILISLGILGPITEEIIFRGILVGKLSKKIPTYLSIIISSFLFMMIHIHIFKLDEFLYFLSYFTTGIIYSVAYKKTNNISIPIILHILNNFPALLVMILGSL